MSSSSKALKIIFSIVFLNKVLIFVENSFTRDETIELTEEDFQIYKNWTVRDFYV